MKWISTALLSLASWSMAGAAQAAWPDDISLSSLATWGGAEPDPVVIQDAYETVVNELGVAIANKPMAPGETLGIYGFDVGLSGTLAFTTTKEDDSPWARVHEDGDPSPVMIIPTLQVRKGLPLSLEVGANMGYIVASRQTTFGGYGRWAIVEGYRPIPDLTIQVGYTGYVGNQELELGVMDSSLTLGYTLPFGTLVGINQAQFCPYLGGGTLVIHASPRLDEETQTELGIGPVSGFKSGKNISYDAAYSHFNMQGGFRIVNNDFQFRLAGTFAPGVIATFNVGMGFVY